MQFQNDIKKDYIETKESLRLTFPEAYNFLTIATKGYNITIHQTAFVDTFFDTLIQTITSFADKGNLLELSNEINDLANEQQLYTFTDNIEDEKLLEGIRRTITTTYYERNQKARTKCLSHWKYDCAVCGFNFEQTYGQHGKDYIHVHHKTPVSEIKKEYEIDAVNDLVPVCPNCHAMLHRNKETLTIEELKNMINKTKNNGS